MSEINRMRWDAIIDRCPNARLGAELGVLGGKTSEQLLAAIPELTLYMIDRWRTYSKDEIERTPYSQFPSRPQSFFDKAYRQAKAVAARYSPRGKIVLADTEKAAEIVPDGLDFVFVDADHSYDGVVRDIETWLKKIKPGGWIIGHDYGSDKRHPDVRRAVDEIFGDRVETDDDYIWAVKV